jgi:hypothetical protein
MKYKLCKAGIQLREQIDDSFPDRDRRSDGWIGDARHAARPSDHNPDEQNIVWAIDTDKDLSGKAKPDFASDLADQLRRYAKAHGRITYIIYNGKIASSKRNWRWRTYSGINSHASHIHCSFSKKDDSSAFFDIPLLGGKL